MDFTSSPQAYRITRAEWPWRFSPCTIRKTPGRGSRRRWQIRPEESPLLFWGNDGYGLADAKARALAVGGPIRPADRGAVGSLEEYVLALIEAARP